MKLRKIVKVSPLIVTFVEGIFILELNVLLIMPFVEAVENGHFLKVCLSKKNESFVLSVSEKYVEYSVGGFVYNNKNSLYVDINFNNSSVQF